MYKLKKFRFALLCVALTLSLCATSAGAVTPPPKESSKDNLATQAAPLSPSFIQWQQEQQRQKNPNLQKDSSSKGTDAPNKILGGYIPDPQDLSHLKKNPPKPQGSFLMKDMGPSLPEKFSLRDANRLTRHSRRWSRTT
ncbi:MAG: hypothetical protein IJP91_07090 [Synergistaceae bacterium]|nr:hypothetical protein [Synergistaceae bacterium]